MKKLIIQNLRKNNKLALASQCLLVIGLISIIGSNAYASVANNTQIKNLKSKKTIKDKLECRFIAAPGVPVLDSYVISKIKTGVIKAEWYLKGDIQQEFIGKTIFSRFDKIIKKIAKTTGQKVIGYFFNSKKISNVSVNMRFAIIPSLQTKNTIPGFWIASYPKEFGGGDEEIISSREINCVPVI